MTRLPIILEPSASPSSSPAAAAPAAAVEPTVAASSALLPVYGRLPVCLVAGEGVELIDEGGRRYLDFTSGIAVNALGYGDDALRQVMVTAASGLLHVSNLYHTTPAERLAELLVAHCPWAQHGGGVFFCNSGAEANEGAFKFARRWAREIGGPAKHEIIALRGSFHGRLFASLAATDRPAYRAPFRPLAGGVAIVERDMEALDVALDAATAAALILEPVQGEGGVRVLDPGFLGELRALATERRIALIVDEVQCGLGRTGHLFAHAASGIAPDLMTLAKPLAAGLPMGAVVAAPEIATTLRPGDHATTFGGGPFLATVATHVVERLADPALLDAVRTDGAWMGERLRAIAVRTGRARAARGVGYLWGLDVVEPARDIVARALEAGLLICAAGDHTVRLLPPLVARREELARGLDILEDVLCMD